MRQSWILALDSCSEAVFFQKKNASQINERRLLMLLDLFPVLVVKVIFQIRVSISWYYFYPALMVKEPFGAGRWKTFC